MTEKELTDVDELDEVDLDPEASDDEWDETLDDVDVDVDVDVDDADVDDADVDDEDDLAVAGATVAVADNESDAEEALDELEAEELDMLTDDEESETLIVDEAQELRAIRRAEISLQSGGATSERTEGEFVCQSCFLVLKSSQLANKRKMLCRDCAA